MEQRNLVLAIALSLAILIGFQLLFPGKQPEVADQQAPAQTAGTVAAPVAPSGAVAAVPGAPPPLPGAGEMAASRAEAISRSARVAIDSPRLRGSISLTGGRIDDLWLRDYCETQDPNSEQVLLLSPPGAPNAYYAEFGLIGDAGAALAVPNGDTVWKADGGALTPARPLTLSWDNGQGLKFSRIYKVDAGVELADTIRGDVCASSQKRKTGGYLITVTQRIENSGDTAVSLYPYGLVSRTGTPVVAGSYILHEGPIGVFGGTLKEVAYKDLLKAPVEAKSTGGWLGITDKYWLVALAPDQAQAFDGGFRHSTVPGPAGATDKYQVDFRHAAVTVPRGGIAEVTDDLFAGAKEVVTLENYRDGHGIVRFDLAVDWGWFFFLTKPIFLAIDALYRATGNFGIAIIIFTMFMRLLFFPLANRSFKSFAGMRRIQPEMLKIREAYKDDKERLTKETMELYKKAGVNPLSGCLPILMQIPVFFSLYKTLYVTIEMRHAPFYGWIHDLSAPDPTSLFNLFGLIPWTPPLFLAIGIWPLLMGVSMFLQQKLNPAPPDPVQARMFMFMPVIFTFVLAKFPAGLVIYWTTNNVLSMAQQWIIMRRADAAKPLVPKTG